MEAGTQRGCRPEESSPLEPEAGTEVDPPVSFQVVSKFDLKSEAEDKEKESRANSLLESRLGQRLAVIVDSAKVEKQVDAGFV